MSQCAHKQTYPGVKKASAQHFCLACFASVLRQSSAPESARMFCQRNCWLLNMIDRRVCVCCFSCAHNWPPVAGQTLPLPVTHQRASLSKIPHCSAESLYKRSLPSASPPFHIPAVLPLHPQPPPPARYRKRRHDCSFY